jgi:hypothetical protein
VIRVVIALGLPLGEIGRALGVELSVADRGGRLAASSTLTFAFADGEANDRQPRDREVDRVVARTYADRALRSAVGANRRGAWDEVRDDLLAVARKVRRYAGGDEVLVGIVGELERQADAWSVERMEADRKMLYSAASYSLKSRVASGRAMRRSSPHDPNA